MTVTSNASSIAYFPVIRNLLMQGHHLSLVASHNTRGKQRSGWNSSDPLITIAACCHNRIPILSSPRHADVVRVRDGRRPVPTSRPVMCQSLQKKLAGKKIQSLQKKKKNGKKIEWKERAKNKCEKSECEKKKKKQLWLEQHLCEIVMETPDALHFQQICCIWSSASPARAEELTRSVTNNSKWCSNKYEWNHYSCRRANSGWQSVTNNSDKYEWNAGSSISSSTGCFFTAHFCDPLRACQNIKLRSSYINTPL